MSTDKLLRNGTVLFYSKHTHKLEVLHKASILIKKGVIAKIAAESEIDGLISETTEIIDVSGKIVAPGFVDTHRHSWLTVYRTLCPNVTLGSYLFWVSQMSPVVRASLTAQDIYDSTLAGLYEAVNAGITTVVEHAHNNWSPEVMERGFGACIDSGLRMIWCFALQAQVAFSLKEQIQTCTSIARQHEGSNNLVTFGMAWDSIGMDSESAVRDKKKFFSDLNMKAITTHCMVGPWGSEHANSVENADKLGILDMGVPVIFSHAGYITDTDKALIRQKNHFIAVTPESEMHYGHGQSTCFDIPDHTALGIDTACTFSGDMISQARLWLQINRAKRYDETLASGLIPRQNPMDVEEAFLMATRQGGLALHSEEIGIIAVGAKADVVVFDGNSPNMCGWQNPVAAVVLHANSADIVHVLIDGEFRKKDGVLVMSEPWEHLSSRLQMLAARAQAENRAPPAAGDTLWGMAYGDVDIVKTRLP